MNTLTTTNHKELNYNVFYHYLIGVNNVKFTYVLTYNSNNLTYYVGEFTEKYSNHTAFNVGVEKKILSFLKRNKTDFKTINSNIILLSNLVTFTNK